MKRLDSWKTIADYLDRSLRTVQRWHACNGLPVHHFGGQKGSVFAYAEEIDHWLASLAEDPGTAQARTDETLSLGKRNSDELTASADSMWETRSERNIHTIADLYRKAIDADSANAVAFTGLANAMVYCALNDIVDGALAYPSALDALRRVPQLESERLGARCPAAWIDMLYKHNWRQARSGFDEVLRNRPSSFALSGLAVMHVAEGRILEASECAWEAWKLNPLVCSLGALLCWIVYLSGEFEQALDLAAQIRAGGGAGAMVATIEALVLIQNGPLAASLNRLEMAAANYPQNTTLQGILGYAYGMSGQTTNARAKLARLAGSSEIKRKSNGYGLAIVSIGLGNGQEAVSWLEAAYAEGTLWGLGLRSDPILRSLRGDPRFESLISKLGGATPGRAESGFQKWASNPFLEDALAGSHP
jgi:tetratricopeptide (TPR) repeat protein